MQGMDFQKHRVEPWYGLLGGDIAVPTGLGEPVLHGRRQGRRSASNAWMIRAVTSLRISVWLGIGLFLQCHYIQLCRKGTFFETRPDLGGRLPGKFPISRGRIRRQPADKVAFETGSRRRHVSGLNATKMRLPRYQTVCGGIFVLVRLPLSTCPPCRPPLGDVGCRTRQGGI